MIIKLLLLSLSLLLFLHYRQLEKQQAQIARNIRQSAAELSKHNDDDL